MYHLTVYLHLLAAMVWVGGLLFLALVVVPVTRSRARLGLDGRMPARSRDCAAARPGSQEYRSVLALLVVALAVALVRGLPG